MTKYAKILDFFKKIVYNPLTIEKILKEWEKIPLFSFEKEKFNLSNIEQKTELLVEEPIRKLGYELYDVEYIKEGKDYFLRIERLPSQGFSSSEVPGHKSQEHRR